MRGSVLFASAALVLAPVFTGCDDDADSLSGHPAAAGAGQAGSAPFESQAGAGGEEERGGATASGGSANEPSAGNHSSAGTRNPSGRGGSASGAAGRSAGRGGEAGGGASGRAGSGASSGAGAAAGTSLGGGGQAGTGGTSEGGAPSDGGAPASGGSAGTPELPELHICDRLSEPAFTVYSVVIDRYDLDVWYDCRVRGFVYNYLEAMKRAQFTTNLMNDSLRLWGCSSEPPTGFTLIWGTPPISRADVDVLLAHYLEATDAEVLLSDTERRVLEARVRDLAEPLVVDELDGFSESLCPPDAGAGGEGGGAGAGPGAEAGRVDGS